WVSPMHAAALLILLAATPLDKAKDEQTKKELVKLQGVWRLVPVFGGPLPAVAVPGGPIPPPGPAPGVFPMAPNPRFRGTTLVIVGNQYVFSTHAGTI